MRLIFQPQPVIQKEVDKTKVLGSKVVDQLKSLVKRAKTINGGDQVLESLGNNMRRVDEKTRDPNSSTAKIFKNRTLDDIQDSAPATKKGDDLQGRND